GGGIPRLESPPDAPAQKQDRRPEQRRHAVDQQPRGAGGRRLVARECKHAAVRERNAGVLCPEAVSRPARDRVGRPYLYRQFAEAWLSLPLARVPVVADAAALRFIQNAQEQTQFARRRLVLHSGRVEWMVQLQGVRVAVALADRGPSAQTGIADDNIP